VVALGVAGFLAWRWQAERELRRRQLAVRDRDLGQSLLVIRAFDWESGDAHRDRHHGRALQLDAGAARSCR
jgi:hypothetical protein